MLLLAAALAILPPVPGAINPNVTQANLATTICQRGWTATVRPPLYFMLRIKGQLMRAAGLTDFHAVELDHLVPLELGGSPDSPANLWLEPWAGRWGAHTKDRLENALHRLVCAGTITLAQAQHEIATDWMASYRLRVH